MSSNMVVTIQVKLQWLQKLDGVGPVDNRPSTAWLHHFVKQKNKKCYMICDMWHMTRDMWHVTCDTWHITSRGRWTFSQNCSSLAFTVWEWRFVEDVFTKDESLTDWMNELISDKAVCRTAPSVKYQVEMPPLMMQDDTFALSTYGFKTMKINSLINTQTNIMGLQFGKDKCIKMHIGRN